MCGARDFVTYEYHSRAMMMPTFAGWMSSEEQIMRMVTMLALGTPGIAREPIAERILLGHQ